MSHQVPERNEEICSSCGLLLDVTGEPLLALVKCPRCRSEIRVRKVSGSYELLEILGQGGSGCVFHARPERSVESESPISDVALKVLEKSHPDYEEHLILLRNEALFSGLIQHQRVVKVMALEEDETGARLRMELMEGGSLHDRIVSGTKFEEMRILEMGLEILKALSAAHAKGIVHRDLKPANILFTASGGAKLGDFGLARMALAAESADGETETGQHLIATPDYVAPEILAGEAGDFRSDIYGLGSTLYHVLTGQPPYSTDGKTLEELRLLKRGMVKISYEKWKIAPGTAVLLNRMLDPDPGRRFASYAELESAFRLSLERLERAKGGGSLQAKPLERLFALIEFRKKS